MKTVKDYLDLGLVLSDGDKLSSAVEDGWVYKKSESHLPLKYHGVVSFAWRNNDGVKPEYKGVIEVECESGRTHKGISRDFMYWFDDGTIIKWRPVVLQSDDANKKIQEKFLSALYADSQASNNVWNAIREQFRLPIGIDSPELREALKSLKEHLENKPPFWNKSIKTLNCPCVSVNIETRKPALSPKEASPMKPVYTAEMRAKGELPPVDSKVTVCIKSAWFGVDEQDLKFEGKTVTVRAAFSNAESEKIVAVENEDGNCACYIIECIKPIIKTIKVNGFDVPEPMSEAPKFGSTFYSPIVYMKSFANKSLWSGDDIEILWLSRGLIHSTESAAIAHAKAMLGIDPNA